MTDINGITPPEDTTKDESHTPTPSSAMSANESDEKPADHEFTSLDVDDSDIHPKDEEFDGAASDESPGLPTWLPRSEAFHTKGDSTSQSHDGEDLAEADISPTLSTPSPEPATSGGLEESKEAEPKSDESVQTELEDQTLPQGSPEDDEAPQEDEANESDESALSSSTPSESEAVELVAEDAHSIPTYTAAIQKLTKAMVSGQLAQKLRGRLAKHSQEVAAHNPVDRDDTGDVSSDRATAAPSDTGADEITDTGDLEDENVAETPRHVTDDDCEVDTDSADDLDSGDFARDEADLPEGSQNNEDTITSADASEVKPEEDIKDTQSISLTASDQLADDDLPPLQMPNDAAEPSRIKFTRSGLKVMNLPAGTQVLSNSLRSVRSTFDTLQTGGRIDPTRPTIVLFAVGVFGAFILSAGTLMGSLNFDGFSGFEADAPPPVASSPEAIPEQEEDEGSEEVNTVPPEIAEITVISYNDDGGDHQELADRMIDNDTATAWQSRYFATPDLPEDNTIRLIITLKESVPVTEVIFTGAIEGGQVDLRVNNGEDPFSGTPLTSAEMGQTTTLKPSEPVEGNTIALNFVSLPKDDEGRNRVKITELQVR
ncbi:MAG: hypothetical protein Q4P05_06125 [Actinomycetaceae bacterium]|nr:hypothetical protein [Actinomycetaceae bacterium]